MQAVRQEFVCVGAFVWNFGKLGCLLFVHFEGSEMENQATKVNIIA